MAENYLQELSTEKFSAYRNYLRTTMGRLALTDNKQHAVRALSGRRAAVRGPDCDSAQLVAEAERQPWRATSPRRRRRRGGVSPLGEQGRHSATRAKARCRVAPASRLPPQRLPERRRRARSRHRRRRGGEGRRREQPPGRPARIASRARTWRSGRRPRRRRRRWLRFFAAFQWAELSVAAAADASAAWAAAAASAAKTNEPGCAWPPRSPRPAPALAPAPGYRSPPPPQPQLPILAPHLAPSRQARLCCFMRDSCRGWCRGCLRNTTP